MLDANKTMLAEITNRFMRRHDETERMLQSLLNAEAREIRDDLIDLRAKVKAEEDHEPLNEALRESYLLKQNLRAALNQMRIARNRRASITRIARNAGWDSDESPFPRMLPEMPTKQFRR